MLQSMDSKRTGHDLTTEQQQPSWLNSKESLTNTGNEGDVGLIPGSRRSPGWEDNLEKESAPLFFLGKSHGQGSLGGYSPWGCKELDMAEQLSMHTHNKINGFISPHKVSSKMLAQYVWNAK